jgi:simple sugar transport system substrate-binding protein
MKVSKLVRPRSRKRIGLFALAVPALLAAAALTGCTPGGGSTTDPTGGASSGGDAGAGVNIVVIGGDDAFFSTVKRGIEDAAKTVESYGGKVTYLALKDYSNIGPDAAQLVKNALGQNPSAVLVPDWVPEAEDPAIQEVIDAGIPVIIYNAGGMDAVEKLGALTYVGTDEYLAGVASGEEFGEAGIKNIVCVNTVPGAQNLEDRCRGNADGIAKSGGKSTQLALPASSYGNQTAVAQAIKAALQQDPTVDGLVTVGGSDSGAAIDALNQAGVSGKVAYGHMNVDMQILDGIKDGTVAFAIDQQPYAQGFYTVSAAFQYVAFGVELPTKPILTGPLVINADNVDKAVSGTEEGVR